MTMKDAIAHFTKHDVVAAPVNTIAQAAQDPHPWERRAMVEVLDFLAGTIAVSGDFWHFSRTPAVVGSTPKVGEHNDEVLSGFLGYSEEEIAGLYAKDVISTSRITDDTSFRLKPRSNPSELEMTVARLPLATRESVPETQRTIFDEMVKGLGSIPRYGPGSVLIHVPKAHSGPRS